MYPQIRGVFLVATVATLYDGAEVIFYIYVRIYMIISVTLDIMIVYCKCMTALIEYYNVAC